jgi:signal transduction histidine kinase
VSDASDTALTALNEFAAAVAHEIRTPLTAVAGEIEVALRRDRSAEEYRDVLRRISSGVSELVAISGDLTLLGEPVRVLHPRGGSAASLDAILLAIRNRYPGDAGVRVAVGDADSARVNGDQQRLTRAVTLVVEHAIRHRKGKACVSVHTAAASDDHVRVVVDAQPSGFWPQAWSSLGLDSAPAAMPLRLRTARRLLEDNGGSIAVAPASGADVVHILLHTA